MFLKKTKSKVTIFRIAKINFYVYVKSFVGTLISYALYQEIHAAPFCRVIEQNQNIFSEKLYSKTGNTVEKSKGLPIYLYNRFDFLSVTNYESLVGQSKRWNKQKPP